MTATPLTRARPLPATAAPLALTYMHTDTRTATQASHAVRTALTQRHLTQPHTDRACAVVYELADNAARHVGGPIRVAVTLTRDEISIEVYDQGRARETGTGHGGLALVRHLADKFEIIPGPAGKTAHAVISHHPPAGA